MTEFLYGLAFVLIVVVIFVWVGVFFMWMDDNADRN